MPSTLRGVGSLRELVGVGGFGGRGVRGGFGWGSKPPAKHMIDEARYWSRQLLKKEEQNLISDIWEKWGRHIWGKGVLGILFTSGAQLGNEDLGPVAPLRRLKPDCVHLGWAVCGGRGGGCRGWGAGVVGYGGLAGGGVRRAGGWRRSRMGWRASRPQVFFSHPPI